MEIITKIVTAILSMNSTVFIALMMMLLCLIFRGGIQNALRSGLCFAAGITGINALMGMAIASLEPIAQGISENLGITANQIDLGYAAGNMTVWPGMILVLLGILVIDVIMVSLKWTKTLWTDIHNMWHGQYVGAIAWICTGNIAVGVAAALIAMVISLKLADHHAKRFQEFNEIGNVTLIATAATLPATFAEICMKAIDRIPGLNRVNVDADEMKERFGVFGENITIGAVLGTILSLLAGISVSEALYNGIVLGATLGLFPRIAGLIVEGIVPLSTAITAFMKKRFPGRELNIAVDGAVLLGHPSVMSTFVIMVPISVVLCMVVPGIYFIPIASLTALPYWIGAIVPYTRGNYVHTILVTSLWIILSSVIASAMAGTITATLGALGYYTEEIAAGSLFTCWDEGGNIFFFFFKVITDFIG